MTGKNEGIFVHGVEFGVEKLLIDGKLEGPQGHQWIAVRPTIFRQNESQEDTGVFDPRDFSEEGGVAIAIAGGTHEGGYLNDEQRRIARITIDALESEFDGNGYHTQLTPPGIEMNEFDKSNSLTLFIRVPEGRTHEDVNKVANEELNLLKRERDMYKRGHDVATAQPKSDQDDEQKQFIEVRNQVKRIAYDKAPILVTEPTEADSMIDEMARFILRRDKERDLKAAADHLGGIELAENDNVDVREVKPNDPTKDKGTGTNPT